MSSQTTTKTKTTTKPTWPMATDLILDPILAEVSEAMFAAKEGGASTQEAILLAGAIASEVAKTATWWAIQISKGAGS